MSEIESKKSFEDYATENGMLYWWASDYYKMLGYASMDSFKKPINKAIKSCMSANISFHDDFKHNKRIINDKEIEDYKLSRFACYMVAMNADIKKPQVAKAQVYFADQVEKINLLLEGKNDIERLHYRDEITEGNKSLASSAKNFGVHNFAYFQDAGYRGLYNNTIGKIKTKKGLKKNQDHFDYMGRTELAANLFRITLTEEKLKTIPKSGQKVAEKVHNSVGKQVRKMVIDNTGQTPEDLPKERRLGEAKKQLKQASKKLNSKTTK